MSIVKRLTENIVDRDLQKEGAALLNKWEATGLLEGIDSDREKATMCRLLENQAKELLREASSMSAGDVEGFASVAFPIVRRVFGGLVANKLVSVQPMSLPSGLIFFLDFTHQVNKLGSVAAESLHGGGKVGKGIQDGVSLTGANAEKGFYALNNGYAAATQSMTTTTTLVSSGSVGAGGAAILDGTVGAVAGYQDASMLRFDPDLVSGSKWAACTIPVSELTTGQFDLKNLISLNMTLAANGGSQLRRLTRIDPNDSSKVIVVCNGTASAAVLATALDAANSSDGAIDDKFSAAAEVGGVKGASLWDLENESSIPEIDIKVDSISVTAQTKKLKAKWSPELGQDLNAYHNLDAEVELTSVLSEQIALEIDREILEDLVKGAATKLYWSRKPGKFVNRETGADITTTNFPDFTGTVSEWYETLIETVNDVSAQIHRKTIRGGANFMVCGPEVAALLEMTAGFRASIAVDSDGQAGAQKVGSISKKWDVHVDPYFPRNVILVGRKGGSFLESGYVYAPYVPLQVTPTIFGTEDFVPRKGVMTRYGKEMVRADMYGLVVVADLIG
jgi:hypothetical protein